MKRSECQLDDKPVVCVCVFAPGMRQKEGEESGSRGWTGTNATETKHWSTNNISELL